MSGRRFVAATSSRRETSAMNEQLAEIQRLLRNLIRIGTVSAVNLDGGLCRVDTGKNTTNWLQSAFIKFKSQNQEEILEKLPFSEIYNYVEKSKKRN